MDCSPKEDADSALWSRKPPGNGHLYILMFSRAWLKFRNAIRRQLRCDWNVAIEVPYHACELEATFPEYDPMILEDIDAEASIKSTLGDTWPDEWFLNRFGFSFDHWIFTFPAFAVAKGLTRYLGYVLSKSSTSAERFINSKAGRPLFHVVGYASQTIELNHHLLLLEPLLKHDVDMNAKYGFGRSFLEVLYWNNKQLPGRFWQLMVDKGARITRGMVTRNDLYSQTDASPTIFSHLWAARGQPKLSSLGIYALNGVLLMDLKLGSKIAVSRSSWARDQFSMRSNEEEEEAQFGHQKKAKHEEGWRRKSNEDEDEGENEQDQTDVEEQIIEGANDAMFSDWDEETCNTWNSEFALTQGMRRPDYQRSELYSELYSLLHVPFEARAAPGALLGKEKLSGKKIFEVFDLGILDESGPSRTSQDAYRILRQEVFRKERYYTPEAAKRALEIDPGWFVERVEVQTEPEPEPERLLAKWRRHMPF